jgi:hypothetical protein
MNDYRQTTLWVNYYPKKKKGDPNYSCDDNNFFPSKSDIDSLPIHVPESVLRITLEGLLLIIIKPMPARATKTAPPARNILSPPEMNITTIPVTNSAIGPIKRVSIFYHLPFEMY